jgi:hypothetical protein
MHPFIIKIVPVVLRAAKITIIVAPHALAIYQKIKAQKTTPLAHIQSIKPTKPKLVKRIK